MSHPFLQDGSAGDPSASSQSQILLHVKKLLAEACLCLDALDHSMLAGLRSNEEYKDAIGHLLKPLTTVPLSNLFNKALTNTMEALTAQLGSLITSLDSDAGVEHNTKDFVDPSRIASPSNMDLTRSQQNPELRRSQTIVRPSHRQNPLSPPTQAGFGLGPSRAQPPMAQQFDQETVKKALEEIKRNRRMMATIYFVHGGKKSSVTMPHLVEEMNKAPSVIALGGISCAWETTRGDIVIALRVQPATTFTNLKSSETMVDESSHLWTSDSAAVVRLGGENPIHVFEIQVIGGGDPRVDWVSTIRTAMQQELKSLLSTRRNGVHLSIMPLGPWSKHWMVCDARKSNIQTLLAEQWPRDYKTMVRHGSTDVEVEIRMNPRCIEDTFDFRV